MSHQKPPFLTARALLRYLPLLFLTVLFTSLSLTGELPPGSSRIMVPLSAGLSGFALLGLFTVQLVRYLAWEYCTDGYVAVMVRRRGYVGASAQNVLDHVRIVFDEWSCVFSGDYPVGKVAARGVIWITFESKELQIGGRGVQGFTTPGTRRVMVHYPNRHPALRGLALAHELGHIIQGEVTGRWGEEEHHATARHHGLA